MGPCISCSKQNKSQSPTLSSSLRKSSRLSSASKVHPDLSEKDLEEASDAPYALVEDKAKTKDDVDFLRKCLSKNSVFAELSREQLDSVISHMRYYIFQPDEVVFQQGSVGSVFFVVAHGRLDIINNGSLVNEIGPSACFGEVALLNVTPRTATVRTVESTRLWGVDRKTFTSTLDQLNANEYTENKNLIMSIPEFSVLNATQLEQLISSTKIVVYGPGQVIVTQGEVGDLLFIIKQGCVTCDENGKIIRTMEKGQFFGEKALFSQNSLRSATVTATEYVKCLTIGRTRLAELLGSSIQMLVHKNTARVAFDKNSYLQKLTRAQYEKLLSCMEISERPARSKVIEAGVKKNEKIFIVLKGELSDERGIIWFSESDVIGIEEVIQDIEEEFKLNYLAASEATIGSIEKAKFLEALGGDYTKIIELNQVIRSLKNFEIFKNLNEGELERLSRVVQIGRYPKNSFIFSQGEEGVFMCLVISGQVDVLVNGLIVRTVSKNGYFGERSVCNKNIRSATAKCRSDVECWVLLTSDLADIFDKKQKDLLNQRIELQDDRINLNDLQFVRHVGTGTYGNVFLVLHKTRKTLLALKTVSRLKIQAFEIHENLIQERNSLLQVDHMLIFKLVKTFKDEQRLYFLSEFVNGIPLNEIQKNLNKFSISECKFYSACILLMLEYLHGQSIIYRGLNPFNIMIDIDGYPKLIDFGTAKLMKDRTYTIVNTDFHYTAPEIISGHGYSFNSDYFSVGVLLYELIYGELPFGENENDAYTIYDSILKCCLQFPEDSDNSDKIKELLGQLMNKDPGQRVKGGAEKLKTHTWFISVNWEKLNRRELVTSYKPLLRGLEKDVEAAMRHKKDLMEAISETEKNQLVPKRRANEKVAPNWDDEFGSV